ncbi:MAG TPA: subclass B3 metallo-beta-lactamase [Thermoanaerobaculia bacterium]|nr:subclass B3 metallo-beta-lactamase [Thermoanaerobaculia bacterium]
MRTAALYRPLLALVLLPLLLPALVRAQADPAARSRNQPVEPYPIAGNLYSVGASDVTSFLITTPEGHILLDGGFAKTAPMIEANVRKLGFKLEDVKILLSSHAHFDHAGGLAELQRKTGARLYAGAADVDLLARGGSGDFAFGDTLRFPAVHVDHPVHDGETVRLGGTTLTAHATPGHTRGCTSWSLVVEEGGKRYDVVFVGSTTINPGVHLAGKPSYPGIAEDYAKSFATLKALPCDIFLGSHASFYRGPEKAERRKKGEKPNPFVDPQGYRDFLAGTEKAYREQLDREKAAAVNRAAAKRETAPSGHP